MSAAQSTCLAALLLLLLLLAPGHLGVRAQANPPEGSFSSPDAVAERSPSPSPANPPPVSLISPPPLDFTPPTSPPPPGESSSVGGTDMALLLDPFAPTVINTNNVILKLALKLEDAPFPLERSQQENVVLALHRATTFWWHQKAVQVGKLVGTTAFFLWG
jgi:hypothetical protein